MRAPSENKNPAPSVNGCRAHESDQAANQINSQNSNTLEHGQGAINSLVAVHRSWGLPADELIGLLLDRGVSEQAMMHPYCIGGGRAVFHRNTFEADLDGDPVITFRAEDIGEVVDLIAWDPATGRVASWRGQAFCLGDLDQVLNPGTYFSEGALWVHETPLEWLLAGRRDIVLLRPELCNAYLAHGARIAVSTVEFGLNLKRWLQPSPPTAKIYVRART
jgi:hypothetical protein